MTDDALFPAEEPASTDDALFPAEEPASTDPMHRLLRDTVHELASDADVISDRDRHRLAVHAVDRAHTLRARRRGAVAATVAVVTALAVGLPYGLRYLDSGTDPGPSVAELPAGVADIPGVPTHVIDDATEPIALVDGWYVAGNQLVLNRMTRSYDSFGNVFEANLSPDGRWVVTSGSNPGLRVYDLEDGGSRRYDVTGAETWSPDGRTLLVQPWVDQPDEGANPSLEFTLIDVASGGMTDHSIDLTGLECGRCALTWLPSGDELALVLGDSEAGAAATAIQIFSIDGERLRTLPIRGMPAGTGAWSPDGRHVVVARSGYVLDPRGNRAAVVDATGEVVLPLDDLGLAQAQWIDNSRFIAWSAVPDGDRTDAYFPAIASLWTIDGQLLERWLPPIEIVRLIPIPQSNPLAIHIG